MIKNIFFKSAFLLLLLTMYSCAVEELATAKTEATELKAKNVNPVFLAHDLSMYNIDPIWKTLITFENNNNAIEVSYTKNKKLAIPVHELKGKKIMGTQRLLLTIGLDQKVKTTVVKYIPDATFQGHINEVNVSNFKKLKFSGKITFQYLDQEKIFSWHIMNGELIKKTTGTKKSNTAKTNSQDCVTTTYYLDWYEWRDGEWVYLYTTIEDSVTECPSPEDNPCEDPTSCECNPNNPGCTPEEPEERAECLNEDFSAVLRNMSHTSEFLDSRIALDDSETTSKFYTWKCLVGTKTEVTSVELGVLRKTNNPALPYEWESLTHQSVALNSWERFVVVSISNDYGVATLGKYYTIMEISFHLKASAVCEGMPFADNENYAANHIFNVHD